MLDSLLASISDFSSLEWTQRSHFVFFAQEQPVATRLSDCRFLHGNEMPTCQAVVDKHFVGYSTLQFIVRGSLRLAYNASEHSLSGRWTFPAFPGPRIRFGLAPGCHSWHHRYVAVTGPLVDQWRHEGLWPSGPEPVPSDLPLEARFDEMLTLFRSGKTQRGTNALESILLLLAEVRQQPSGPTWLDEAKEALAQPDGFRTDIEALAASFAVGASTFRRSFKAATGSSPRDWALHARLELARERLISSTEPVGDIARDLGYRDVFFFSRQFTTHTGLSPSAYRRTRLSS
jgi:AraC-like DNA-binding protein